MGLGLPLKRSEGVTMWGTGKKTRVKILLVDYEKDFARALKIRLKGSGYDVVLAFDSIQGIVMAKKEQPQLIILEMMIPGGGGFAVAEHLKLSTDTCNIPIIFLTGIPGVEERAYKAGAFCHLMKPYNPYELLDVIKKALEGCEGRARDVGKIERYADAVQMGQVS
jgi:two-component system, OmpR family, copper resistance phosphate regulon response regulator CusR